MSVPYVFSVPLTRVHMYSVHIERALIYPFDADLRLKHSVWHSADNCLFALSYLQSKCIHICCFFDAYE